MERNKDAPYLYNLGQCLAQAKGTYHVCDPELGEQKAIRLCEHHLGWQHTTRCIVVELTSCPRCDGIGHDPCEHCGFSKTQNVAMRNSMRLEHAPFKDFVLEEEGFFANAREFVPQKEIRELADSIEAKGLKVPLGALKRPDGKKLVLSGSRRYRAINLLIKEKRANGLNLKVPFIAVTGKQTEVSARIEGLIDNLHRKDLTSYEMATQLHALHDAGMNQSEIAETINKSQSYVSRLLKCFGATSPAVHKAWKQSKLPDDDVQTLSKLPPAEQDRRLVKLMEHRDVAATAKPGQVRAAKSAARVAAKGGAKPKANEPPKAVRPGGDHIRSFAELTGKAPKNNKYVRGLHDAFRFMLGDLGPGEFDKDFTTWAAKQSGSDKGAKQKTLAAKKPTKK
jgi:ParB/RepB/Spo0J family partition protein